VTVTLFDSARRYLADLVRLVLADAGTGAVGP